MKKLFSILRIIILYFISYICYYLYVIKAILQTSQSTGFSMKKLSADMNKLLQENALLREAKALSKKAKERITELELLLEKALSKINWYEEQFKLMRQRQ